MSSNDTASPESIVTIIYVDASAEHLPTFCDLFENAEGSEMVFQVECCDDIANLSAHVANTHNALIILGGMLSERDKLRACFAAGPDSKYPAPVIVLGPDLGTKELIEYFDLGISDYMVEPFSMNELVARAHRIMSQPSKGADSDLFEGRYAIQGLFGQGGFARVYLALDQSKKDTPKVALKLYPMDNADTTFRSRYLQEAFQLSRINHPNIVRLLDFGKTDTDYFLVTEFVDGTTLEDVHQEHGILSEYQAALVGYYVGSALNHISRASIVHRDLSPRNIMLTHDGEVKVIDFGLAKTHMAATLSTDDKFQGTPYFISPEQILGEDVGTAADLYSLAVTIYFMLTGNYPFDGEDAHEVINAHLNDTPRPLLDFIPDLNPEFSDMIGMAFAKDPDDRPALPDFVRVVKAIIDAYGEQEDEVAEPVE